VSSIREIFIEDVDLSTSIRGSSPTGAIVCDFSVLVIKSISGNSDIIRAVDDYYLCILVGALNMNVTLFGNSFYFSVAKASAGLYVPYGIAKVESS
jgi:hypothetical protein